MSTAPLKVRLQEDVKLAMKARERERLAIIRLIMAAIKQREVDERIELTDAQILDVLTRMLKQRRDSYRQFSDAGRQDLAKQEAFEIDLISAYLPPALDEDELTALIASAISNSAATGPRDMGKVMAILGAQVKGRADMGQVSQRVKEQLTQ